MARSTALVPTRPATLFGEIMWMTVVWKLINSKAGIIGVGIILLFCAWGWHKASVEILEFRIACLKKDAIILTGKVIEQKNRTATCEINLSGTRDALSRQNAKVSSLKVEADQLQAEADAKAIALLTTPEDVEKVVSGPPGHQEMNEFMIDLFGRVYQ